MLKVFEGKQLTAKPWSNMRSNVRLQATQLFDLGCFASNQHKFKEAEQLYRAATQIDPTFIDAQVNLAARLGSGGDYIGAKKCLDTALFLHFHDFEARENMVLLCQRTNDKKNEIKYGLKDSEVLATNIYNEAMVYLQGGDNKSAEILFKKSVELCPELGPPYGALGLIALERGNLREAEELFIQSLKRFSSNPLILFNMAQIYHAQGDLRIARALYEHAIEEAPRSSYLKTILALRGATISEDRDKAAKLASQGDEAMSKGLPDAAVKLYESALKFDAQSSELIGNVAGTYNMLGNVGKALEYYKQAILVAQQNVNGARGKGLFVRRIEEKIAEYNSVMAALFMRKGEMKEAANSIEDSLRIMPNEPLFLFTKGQFLEMSDDINGAMELYQRALSLPTPATKIYGLITLAMQTLRSLPC